MSKNLPQTGCVHLLPYPGRPKLTNIQDSTFLGMWADMRGTRKRMVQRQENFFQRNTSVGSWLGTGHDRLARLLMRLNGCYFSLRGLGCFIHCARNLTHIHVCLCVQSQNRTTRSSLVVGTSEFLASFASTPCFYHIKFPTARSRVTQSHM